MKSSLDVLLEELRTSTQMPEPGALYHLSSLDAEELARVQETWAQLPGDLRRRLLARLAEIAEADFEVNFGAIFRLGMQDEDAEVRTKAIEGLWEDQDVRLVSGLIDCLQDEAVSVRAAAATSLGRFVLLGELGKIRPAPFTRAYEALLTTCRAVEEHVDVWRRALESLAYVCNEDVVELIDRAYETPDEKVHVSAVFAMGRSADTRWAKYVQQELFSPSPELRYEAARASGELQLTETVPALKELVEDADQEVHEAALWALGQIGGDEAREVLELCAQAESEATRAAAAAALDELEFLHGSLSDFFARLAHEPNVPVEP